MPRGALIKSPEGAVFKNYSYYGMNENETAHLSNWLHLRSEMNRPMPKVTDFADADPAIGKHWPPNFKIRGILVTGLFRKFLSRSRLSRGFEFRDWDPDKFRDNRPYLPI